MISATDPGHPNWLDTGHRHRGFVTPPLARQPRRSCRHHDRSRSRGDSMSAVPSRLDRDQLGRRRRRRQTGLDDFGEPTWQEGLDRLAGRASRPRPASTTSASTIVEGEVGELPPQPARHRRPVGAAHPERRRPADRPAPRDRRPAPHRHDDPLRPARPGPGEPGAAHAGRSTCPCPPPTTATYATDPRIDEVRGHRRDGRPRSSPASRAFHPIGARLAQECVRITGGDFRSHDLPDPVRGAHLQPLAARRGRHGPGLPLAPPVPRSTCSRSTWPSGGC